MELRSPQDIFTSFGITQAKNNQGHSIWSIKVCASGTGTETRSAYFDQVRGTWMLESPTNVHCTEQRPSLEPRSHDDTTIHSNIAHTARSEHSSGDPELSNKRDSPAVATTPDIVQQQNVQSISGEAIPENDSIALINTADWTSGLSPSEHVDFFRNKDWTETPLGHCSTWPHSLRLYTHTLFSDTRVSGICWGPKRITFYNESMVTIAGSLHPHLMGRTFEEVMPTLWDYFGPLFHAIEQNQRGFTRNGLELPLMREGVLEETWWDGGAVPLRDDNGNHGGVYFSWVESTRAALQDRRTLLIGKLRQPPLTNTASIWQHIGDVLSEFPRDVPMAVMYSAKELGPDNESFRLERTIGMGPGYTAAPETIDSSSVDQDHAIVRVFRRALECPARYLSIDLTKETIHPSIVENVDWQGFGEPSRHLIIVPLRLGEAVRGYMLLGLNPRSRYDADHELFVDDLVSQLGRLMEKAMTVHQTQERECYLMTELTGTSRRMERLMEIVPTGIYEQGPDGRVQFANAQFFEILGVPLDQRSLDTFNWEDWLSPDDVDEATKAMRENYVDASELTGSLRLKRTYQPPQIGHGPPPAEEAFWFMYSASPNFREDGTVQSLMGCLTDISHLKWTEQLHFRNAEVAQRERKRQEEFIDITSHEMRNPLSAITQCADSIMLSFRDAMVTRDASSLLELIKLNAEAAESILFCAAHQRRIIDDVLTLGKLDSRLLTIFPTVFRPSELIDKALQMFKTEFEVNGIEVHKREDEQSAITHDLPVFGDTSRLMQILVNLLTNAIKFTRVRKIRNITIRYGYAQGEPSTEVFGTGFEWHSTGIVRPDLTQEPDYGQGKAVYLYFAVVDSGTGVPPGFIDKVFSKFEQADRRTHTQYGGSGLGLYISRELAELQGGCIGISSKDGIGSTFAFYTKVRRADAQPSSTSELVHHARSTTTTSQTFPLHSLDDHSISALLPPPRSYHILLVEDNLLNQKVLAKQLRRAGCVVRVSDNGGEAIDQILRMHQQPTEYETPPPQSEESLLPYFDCILMDWEMPVCDGLRATKRIREIEARQGSERNIIIGVTANARAEQIAIAMKAGMDMVMPKPFRVVELLSKIGETVAWDRGAKV